MLVDTSVWIDHFRRSNHDLEYLLVEGLVLVHPFVVGELACGSLARRAEVLNLLQTLPTVLFATQEEVLELIERYGLYSKGLGWTDMNLLASAKLSKQPLWTLDRKLRAAADKLGLSGPE
ncbi:MAG: ribonuclease VapC32 [Acidimicrobiia bacterium]